MFIKNFSQIKLKELEQKVQENQKLKESVDNEAELWKNKANNLKRNSATKKPELINKYKNYASPERITNFIQNNNYNNNYENTRDSVISTIKNTRISNYNEKTMENSQLVANKTEDVERPFTENINTETPSKTMFNNRGSFVSASANLANNTMEKSVNSEDNESDYMENNPRLNAKKVNNKKILVSDINSDVEGLSQK